MIEIIDPGLYPWLYLIYGGITLLMIIMAAAAAAREAEVGFGLALVGFSASFILLAVAPPSSTAQSGTVEPSLL